MGILERGLCQKLSSLYTTSPCIYSSTSVLGDPYFLLSTKYSTTTTTTNKCQVLFPHPPTKMKPCCTFPLNQNLLSPPLLVIMMQKCLYTTGNNNSLPFRCWSCEEKISGTSEFGFLLCPNCGSPQKLVKGEVSGSGPSFYKLLGQPESFTVNVEKLSATAKRLQRKLHPDLFARKGKEEQDLSEELSSLINKAYSTLANPMERGRYLLQLRGVKDPLGDIEKEITNDATFLEEVMELNERLEELSSESEWRKFREQNELVLKTLQSELDIAFNANKIQEAKIILGRMKYFDTLQGKLKELKTKLNIVE